VAHCFLFYVAHISAHADFKFILSPIFNALIDQPIY